MDPVSCVSFLLLKVTLTFFQAHSGLRRQKSTIILIDTDAEGEFCTWLSDRIWVLFKITDEDRTITRFVEGTIVPCAEGTVGLSRSESWENLLQSTLYLLFSLPTEFSTILTQNMLIPLCRNP